MRSIVTVAGLTVLAFGCVSCHGSTTSSPTIARTEARVFATPDAAIASTCHAYWLGDYILGTARSERQWETRAQYGSGTGYIAKIEQVADGYRVGSCRTLRYTHG